MKYFLVAGTMFHFASWQLKNGSSAYFSIMLFIAELKTQFF